MIERPRELGDLLFRALGVAPEEREAFLVREVSDPEVRNELRSLLEGAGGTITSIDELTRPTLESGTPSRLIDPKPLVPGSRLGRYEIRNLLGAGGMGRVYGAHDPTLEREVAIKAINHAFRDDSGSLKRFEREAKVLAALSHPNIASIYGFEQLDGIHYLVLERVEGETLAYELERRPIGLREAINIAAQVASGLAEAHAKGVIHRDLKPSNVMLASSGRVKLVDFGLAKSTAHGVAGAPVSALTTAVGSVVGTAPYMSPEQVRGEEVDSRTDVWAFGCLLYEMLTGQQAFEAVTVPEVLASVLRDEPTYAFLPSTTPPQLARLLRRCLTKEPASRPRDIGDIRLELIEIGAELALSPPGAGGDESKTTTPPPASRRQRLATPKVLGAVIATLAVAALAIAGLMLAQRGQKPAATPLTLSLELPRGVTLSQALAAPFAIAPTGDAIALVASAEGRQQLYLRRLAEPIATPLAGTDNATQPFWSPDGKRLGFFADRKLEVVTLDTGRVVALGDFGSNPRGAAWLPIETIVVSPSQTSGLVRLPASGGPATPLTNLSFAQGERSHRWPVALPGGRWVLFAVGFEGGSYDEARLDVVSVETGERRPVLAAAAYGRYAPSGHLVFVRGGRLHAIAFDLDKLTTSGTAEPVGGTAGDGIRYDPQNGSAHLALSPQGDLLYGPAPALSAESYLSILHRDGLLTRLSETPRMFRDPSLSPDGQRVAVVVGTSNQSDLRVFDPSGTATQLTFGLSPHRPTWTPDGRSITVGVMAPAVDDAPETWQLVTTGDDGKAKLDRQHVGPHRLYPCAWTPDGRQLVFQESNPQTGWDLYLLTVDSKRRPAGPPVPLAATPFHEANAVISANGKWVAYESDELDGVVQIYARALPDGAHKVQVSTGGARWPSWSEDGHLVFWDTTRRRIMAAQTSEQNGNLLVTPAEPALAEVDGVRPSIFGRLVISVTGGRFAIHPHGDRFLVLESTTSVDATPFSNPLYVQRWSERLRAPGSS